MACDLQQLGAELLAFCYGRSRFPRSRAFADEVSDDTLDFAWVFWALRIGERVVLIDCGFDDAGLAAQWGVRCRRPVEMLAEQGIAPDAVGDVIITHHHSDHVGCVGQLPEARVHIHRDELPLVAGEIGEWPVPSARTVVFSDAFTLDDLLQVRPIGGHSPGCAEVRMAYAGRGYRLTGDDCYLLNNVREGRPVGALHNRAANEAYIRELARSPDVIIPAHEPSFFESGDVVRLFGLK